MNFSQIIYYFVLFIVGFVWFTLISFLRLPHMRVGVYAIEPKGAVMGVWRKVQGALLIAFVVIMCIMFFFYGLWIIIKKFVPNFPIPFRKILLKIPPFPQFERAGIFAFIHSIIQAIGGKGKFWTRMERLGKAFGLFIARNTEMMMRAMGMGYLMKSGNNMAASGKYADGDTRLPLSREQRLARNNRRRDSPFEAGAYRKADDELQQCLEENLVPITKDMSNVERQIVAQRNNMSRIVCKARTLQTWSRTLTGRT